MPIENQRTIASVTMLIQNKKKIVNQEL